MDVWYQNGRQGKQRSYDSLWERAPEQDFGVKQWSQPRDLKKEAAIV